MKDPKKTSASKAAPGPGRSKPAPAAPDKAAAGKADPRTVPAPTAPPGVSAGALNALAGIRESATVEPKRAEKPAPARAEPAKAQPAIAKQASKSAAARLDAKPAEAKALPSPPGKPVGHKPAPPAPAPKPVEAMPVQAPAPKPVEARPVAPAPAPSPAILRAVGADEPAPSAASAPNDRPTSSTGQASQVGSPDEAQPSSDPAPPAGMLDAAGWAELNHKMLNLMRSQTEANFALWRSTLGAGSLSEAIRMQTTGVREAYEATAAQWRDIAETAARLMGGPGASMKLPWTDQGR
jgi:hypothetical protein